MKIDILTKQLFDIYQKELIVVLEDMRKQIKKSNDLIFQLQDRVKLLESRKKDDTKRD